MIPKPIELVSLVGRTIVRHVLLTPAERRAMGWAVIPPTQALVLDNGKTIALRNDPAGNVAAGFVEVRGKIGERA